MKREHTKSLRYSPRLYKNFTKLHHYNSKFQEKFKNK